MTTDQVLSLANNIVQLVGVLIWPAVVLLFLVFFRRPIGAFLSGLGELSFKAGGVEATAKRGQAVAAAALGAATVAREAGSDGEQNGVWDVREIADALPGPRAQRRLQGSRVLWVDDHPGNNRFERQALEALNIQVDATTSTESALEMLPGPPYDLIISDMSRPPDPRAGYTLLDALANKGSRTPVVFYTGHQTSEQAAQARSRGAAGSTDSPQELVAIVTRILGGGSN